MARVICVTIFSLLVSFGFAPLAEAAIIAPKTADGFTQMFQDKNDMFWSGGDQNTSFKASNGKIYWLAGDTFTSNGEDPDGSYPDGTAVVSNRIMMQQGDQLVNAMANNGVGVPDPVTHTSANNERYWPSGVVTYNGYGYVLCQRVIKDTDPNSGIDFKLIGSEIAKYSVNSQGKLTFKQMISTPATKVPAGTSPTATQWAGDIIIKDNYAYIYGYNQAGSNNPDWATHYTYLARVPLAKIEQKAEWRFYKKSTNQWVSSTSQLSTDISNPDALMASQVGSVRIINGKVVMLHKPWNGWGSAVYMEVGSAPQGPFVRTKVFDSPSGTWEGKNYITYAPMLHPEQTLGLTDTGKLLVSINWNGQDFWNDVLANADLYKPRFYAIPMPQ